MKYIGLSALMVILFPAPVFAQNACLVPPVTISHEGSISPNTNPNQLVFIDTTKYPEAICNDGSPAALIIRRGLNSAVNRWIVHFEGGGNCITQHTCYTRWQQDTHNGSAPGKLTSSAGFGTPGNVNQQAVDFSVRDETGIMSGNATTNPDFWDATVVQVLYCSSDNFTGDQPGQKPFLPSDTNTWNFNGHKILDAVKETLDKDYGFKKATEVMLTGSSAGGVGAYLSINDLAENLPPTTRLVAMGDAGFFDSSFSAFNNSAPNPYLSSESPTPMQGIEIASYKLWKGHGDKVCTDMATTEEEKLLCRDTSYVMNGGYIKVPTFIAQSDLDTWQLENVEGVLPCQVLNSCSAEEQTQQLKANTYINAFANDLLKHIFSTQAKSPSAAVVIQYPTHTLTDNANFTEVLPQTMNGHMASMAELLGAWYRDPCNRSDEKILSTPMPVTH